MPRTNLMSQPVRPRILAAILVVVFGVALAVLSIAAPVADGATATGCTGRAASFDVDGNLVDRMAAPGAGGTQADPFNIDPAGRVDWRGSTDAVITDGSWSVRTVGFSRSDTFDNEDGNRAARGSTDIGGSVWTSAVANALLSGKTVYQVDVSVTGTGGSCSGTAFITGVSEPAFTPMWITAIVLLLLGIAGIVAAILGTHSTEIAAAGTADAIAAGALDDVVHTKPGTGV